MTKIEEFREWAAANYEFGPGLAKLELEELEKVVKVIFAATEKLEKAFSRLNISRDVEAFEGRIKTTSRSSWKGQSMALVIAEFIGETMMNPASEVALLEILESKFKENA